MEQTELRRKAEQIAELVTGMKYYEWSKIKVGVEQKFASETRKVALTDTEAIIESINLEL